MNEDERPVDRHLFVPAFISAPPVQPEPDEDEDEDDEENDAKDEDEDEELDDDGYSE
jgi:hypothetical protein